MECPICNRDMSDLPPNFGPQRKYCSPRCRKVAAKRANRERHRDSYLEHQRAYRRRIPELVRKWAKQWRDRNLEWARESQRQSRERNRDRIRGRYKVFYANERNRQGKQAYDRWQWRMRGLACAHCGGGGPFSMSLRYMPIC
jgi:hypothetical protein